MKNMTFFNNYSLLRFMFFFLIAFKLELYLVTLIETGNKHSLITLPNTYL